MNKNITIWAMIFVGGIFVGLAGGRLYQRGPSAEMEKLQAQIDQARHMFPPTPQDIRSFSGTVKAVSGNTLSLQTTSANPFDDTPKVRSVSIGSRTKIVMLKQKEAATYQKELASYQEAARTASRTQKPIAVPYPSPFQEIPAAVGDIKEGYFVTVSAEENIRDAESFEARELRITSLGTVAVPVAVPLPPPSR